MVIKPDLQSVMTSMTPAGTRPVLRSILMPEQAALRERERLETVRRRVGRERRAVRRIPRPPQGPGPARLVSDISSVSLVP